MKFVAAGTAHSACVDLDDQVYAWGWGEAGRLGLGDELSRATPTLLTFFQPNDGRRRQLRANAHRQYGIDGIACGHEHTVLWGRFRTRSGLRMVSDSRLYGWGAAGLFQLGNLSSTSSSGSDSTPASAVFPPVGEDAKEAQLVPVRIKDLPPRAAINAAAAGHAHTVVVLASGVTLGMGLAASCDTTSTEDLLTAPTPLGALKGVQAVAVACGAYHTAVLSAQGHAYLLGDNSKGQVRPNGDSTTTITTASDDSDDNEVNPRQEPLSLRLCSGKECSRFNQIRSGGYNTLVCCATTGVWYGLGSLVSQHSPVSVEEMATSETAAISVTDHFMVTAALSREYRVQPDRSDSRDSITVDDQMEWTTSSIDESDSSAVAI